MFYEKYERLCAERGESVTGVARRLRISPNAPAAWANGSAPRNSTVKRIAEYFNVPVSYFDDDDGLTDEIEDTPLVRGFIEELKKRNELTEDENLLLMMFRSMPDTQKQELLRHAMKLKLESEN